MPGVNAPIKKAAKILVRDKETRARLFEATNRMDGRQLSISQFSESQSDFQESIRVFVPGHYNLPIIGTKGGAIQTLFKAFVNENEKTGKLLLETVCFEDAETKEEASAFRKTVVHFIQSSRMKQGKLKEVLDFFRIGIKNAQLLSKETYDVVLFEGSSMFLPLLLVPVIRKKYKNKIVFHFHNKISSLLFSKSFASQAYLVAPSLSLLLDTKKRFDLKGSRGRVVKNCFYPNLQVRADINFRDRVGVEEGEKVVLYVGRVVPEKGVLELVQSFAAIKDKAHLVIVGSSFFFNAPKTKYEKAIQDFVEREGIEGKVHLCGYVDHDELGNVYDACDLCVMPSLCEEAAGLAGIEAMCMGVPVLSTLCGGIPEYLIGPSVSLLSAGGDFVGNLSYAIEEMLFDVSYSRCAREARPKALQRFSSEAYYGEMVGVILSVACRK